MSIHTIYSDNVEVVFIYLSISAKSLVYIEVLLRVLLSSKNTRCPNPKSMLQKT